MRLVAYMLLLSGLASTAMPDGQSVGNVTVTAVDSVSTDATYEETTRQVQIAIEELQRVRPANQPAGQQAEAARQQQQAANLLFQPKWPQLQGSALVSKNHWDILITHWGSSASSDARNLYVWDTPESLLFIFDVDPQLVKSVVKTKIFLEKLLVWGPQSPIETLSAHLELVTAAKAGELRGMGSVIYLRAPAKPRLKGYELDLAVYSVQDKSYVCVLAGKRLFPNIFDFASISIPERFPPLSERLKPMSVSTLIGELDDGEQRNAVVVDEILSRPLTTEEFQRLTESMAPGQEVNRVSLVINELVRLDKVPQFAGPIQDLIGKYEKEDSRGSDILSAILHSLRGYGKKNFSETALELIQKKLAIKESLLYLEFRGETKQQAETLQQLQVPVDMEPLKRRAYREIAKRAGIWNTSR